MTLIIVALIVLFVLVIIGTGRFVTHPTVDEYWYYKSYSGFFNLYYYSGGFDFYNNKLDIEFNYFNKIRITYVFLWEPTNSMRSNYMTISRYFLTDRHCKYLGWYVNFKPFRVVKKSIKTY